jgi:hypothetical protein
MSSQSCVIYTRERLTAATNAPLVIRRSRVWNRPADRLADCVDRSRMDDAGSRHRPSSLPVRHSSCD